MLLFLHLFLTFSVRALNVVYVDYKFFKPLSLIGHRKIGGGGDFYRVYYNSKFLINKVEEIKRDKVIKSWYYEYSATNNLTRCFLKKGWEVHSYFFNSAGEISRESYHFGKRPPYKEVIYTYSHGKLEMKKALYQGQLHSYLRYTYFLSSGFYIEKQFNAGGNVVKHIYYRLNDANQVTEELHYSYGRLKAIYKLQYYSFGFLKTKKERAITKLDAKLNPFKEDIQYPRP